MGQTDKHEIDELLSDYIDGVISERGRTEVKRLIQHDPSIGERLHEFERQKELLNALPIATAPETMLEDVKAAVQRPVPTEDYPVDESAGARHLLYRRVLTAAALVIVPLGILVVVVLNIIMPVPDAKKHRAANLPRLSDLQPVVTPVVKPTVKAVSESGFEPLFQPVSGSDIVEGEDVSYAFNSLLRLDTEQSIAVSSFIEKTIYNSGLLDRTIPSRRPQRSTYRITCPAERMIALLTELQPVWDKCKATSFTIFGPTITSHAAFDNLTADQVAGVFKHDKGEERVVLAKNFARFNAAVGQVSASEVFASVTAGPLDELVPAEPIRPELTSGKDSPGRAVEAEGTQDGEEVTLTIIVVGL